MRGLTPSRPCSDALGGILDLLGDVTVIKIIEDEEKCEELLENSP